jgi:HEAT repeat protein
MTGRFNLVRVAAMLLIALVVVTAVEASAPESKRLIRARDYIADEQWSQAIDLLRAAVDDAKEPRRDEALYWLAHSQHHSGDSGAAVATISRLEREFPTSMWVKPGQSLRIEIAVRLGRSDVLWWTATPRPPTRVPSPTAPAVVTEPAPVPVAGDRPKPAPAPKAIAPKDRPMVVTAAPAIAKPAPMWYDAAAEPDADLRVQALGGLMRIDAERAIPLLAEIAFERDKPSTASRAVIILAQSPLPKARATVIQVAKTGPETVQIAAVRALVGFGGRAVSDDLMQVYVTANDPVKFQIVKSFGDFGQAAPLMKIIHSEKGGKVRDNALISLGRAGGAEQLAALYNTEGVDSRRFIIDGLFSARADAQLIRVANIERKGNLQLRNLALERLKLFNTPLAKQYLQQESMQSGSEKR